MTPVAPARKIRIVPTRRFQLRLPNFQGAVLFQGAVFSACLTAHARTSAGRAYLPPAATPASAPAMVTVRPVDSQLVTGVELVVWRACPAAPPSPASIHGGRGCVWRPGSGRWPV